MRTLIIAEAGVNHNGDPELARQLVDVAAQAGADIVKFQTFKAGRLVTSTASKAQYQVRSSGEKETQFEMLRRLELSRAMHLDLMSRCAQKSIQFLSTGFDIPSLDMLVELGMRCFKIPSGEITNLPYLRHIGRHRLPVILSTGMSELAEVAAALEVLVQAGATRENITVLHCTSEYPAPIVDVNLLAMQTLGRELGVPVGYSDHTEGIEVAIAAVALGASVIEKHVTLSRELPGPDHRASLEPDELRTMVTAIRNIEQAMGDGIKRPCPSEIKNLSVVRKSIVAARAIAAGELFGEDNLTVKRPGTGMSPMCWDNVIGCRAQRAYAQDEPIDA